jgi:hypothetical protein
MRLALITTLALAISATVANAACKQNFTTLGVPLLSQIEYRTLET